MTKSSNSPGARPILWMFLFMAGCALVSLATSLALGKSWFERVDDGVVHGAGFGIAFFVVRPIVFERSTSFLICGLVPGGASALAGGLLRVGLNLVLGEESWHSGLGDVGVLALAVAVVMGFAGLFQVRKPVERTHA